MLGIAELVAHRLRGGAPHCLASDGLRLGQSASFAITAAHLRLRHAKLPSSPVVHAIGGTSTAIESIGAPFNHRIRPELPEPASEVHAVGPRV